MTTHAESKAGNSFAITGFVVSIVSYFLVEFLFAVLLEATALTFSLMGVIMADGWRRGLAIAGIVISAVSIFLTIRFAVT